MRPDTIQEELFKLFANLGGDVTALNSNSYTIQAWLHQINELVAGGGVGAIKVSPTAPVNPAAGDLWYNPSTRILGFWNGAYWLGPSRYLSIPVVFGNSSNQTIRAESAGTTSALYVSSIVHQIAVLNAANTATDYWTARVDLSGTTLTTLSTQNAASYPHSTTAINAVINSRVAIPVGGTLTAIALGQSSRPWYGMATLGSDVYACVFGGDIYKQTGGTGNFVALGQTSRSWTGMTATGSDVYACVYNGDIYKQTGGTGNFVALGQTSRTWYSMTTLGSDVYACVETNGGIYKQTGGVGSFTDLGEPSRGWRGMATLGSDVYASAAGGDIYKQTGGTGSFAALGQASRGWNGMAATGSDVYACVQNGDIYKQTGGTGNFIALGQTARNWNGMTALGSNVYVCVLNGDIYRLTAGSVTSVGHSLEVTLTRFGAVSLPYAAITVNFHEVLS